jgi:hypothetical protein
MAWVFKPAKYLTGDILTVEPVNAEFRALIGEMNGHIDRDNFDEDELTHAEVEVDGFNEITWVDGPTSSSITVTASGAPWQTLASGTISTEDGRIVLEGHYSYDRPWVDIDDNPLGAEVAIRLNGEIVGRSGVGGAPADSVMACACPAVGPGSHEVDLVARYAEANIAYTHVGGGLLARFMRR